MSTFLFLVVCLLVFLITLLVGLLLYVGKKKAEVLARDWPPINKPMLWSFDLGAGPVYLFGYMSNGVHAGEQLPPGVFSLIQNSTLFVNVVDISKLKSNKAARSLFLSFGEPSIHKQLTKAQWKILAEKIGVNYIFFKTAWPFTRHKPLHLVFRLVRHMVSDPLLLPTMPTVLWNHAKQHGTETQALISVDTHLENVFQIWGIERLRTILDEYDDQKKKSMGLCDAYHRGDEETLSSIFFEKLPTNPDFFQTFYFERNQRWLPAVKEYGTLGNVFVSMGIFNLLGEQGLIALLEKEGVEVKRVDFEEVL